ncbi:hypothetical protein GcC1_001001, partial [Golovinomyces cichoracearum]
MANPSHQIHRSGPSFDRSHQRKRSSPRYISPVAMKESEQGDYRSDSLSQSNSLTGSSFSSSSSSYLEISRSRSVERSGISTIFKSPLEHKYRAKKKKKKTRKTFFPFGNNSSSSSVNSDLAYGTGFIKVPKGQVRSQKSKEIPEGSRSKERHSKENHFGRLAQKEHTAQAGSSSERSSYSGSDGRHIKEKARQKRRISNHSSKKHLNDAAMTAEIMAIGAGLAKLDKESNKANLISAQRKSPRYKGMASGNSYKSTRSETKYDSDDAAEWESAYDTESDSSVDSILAYGSESQKSWSLFGGKKQEKKTPPKNFRSDRKAHGTTVRDVRENVHDQDLGPNSYKKRIEYPKKHPENEIPGLSYSFDQISTNPKKIDKVRGPVTSRLNPLVSNNTHGSTRFDSREVDHLIPERSRAAPIQIIQPQPITPVSQSVYEPEKQLKSKYLSSASEQVSFKNPSLYPDKDSRSLNDNVAKTATTSTNHRHDRPKKEISESTDKEPFTKWNTTDLQPEIRRRGTGITQPQRKPSEIQRVPRQEEGNDQKIDREIKVENDKTERERNNDNRRKRGLDFYESPQDWQSSSRLNGKRNRSEVKLKDYSFHDEGENFFPSHDRPDNSQLSGNHPHSRSSKSGIPSSGPSVKDIIYNVPGDYDELNIIKKPRINLDLKNVKITRNEAHYGSDLERNLETLSINHQSTLAHPGEHLCDDGRGHENSPIDQDSNNKDIMSIRKKSPKTTYSPNPITSNTISGSTEEDYQDLRSERWRNENRRDYKESDRDYDSNRSRQGLINDKGNFKGKLNESPQNIVRDHGTTFNIHPHSPSKTKSTGQELDDYVSDSGSIKNFSPEKEDTELRRIPPSFQNELNSRFKFGSESNYPSDVANHTISSVGLDRLDHQNFQNLNPEIDLHRNFSDFNHRQPFKPESKAEEWGNFLGPGLVFEDQSQGTNRPSNNSRAFPKINPSTLQANPYISKNVSWGENETKHFYDDIPFERQQDYMSIPEKQAGSLLGKAPESADYDTIEPSFLKLTRNSRYGTSANNIFRSGASDPSGNPTNSPPRSRFKNDRMPQAPRSKSPTRDQKDDFSTITEIKSKTSGLKDFHEEDMGFIATVAAGLQKTGFNPEIVDNVFGSHLKRNSPNLAESQYRNNVIHGESFPWNESLPSEDLRSQKISSDLPSHSYQSIILPHQKEFKKTMKNRQVISKCATLNEPAGDRINEVLYQLPEKSSDMEQKPKTNVNNKLFGEKNDNDTQSETLEKNLIKPKEVRQDIIGEREQAQLLSKHVFSSEPSSIVQSSEKYMKKEGENLPLSPNRNVVSAKYYSSEEPQISHAFRGKADREGKKRGNFQKLREESQTSISCKDQEEFDNDSKSEMPTNRENFLTSNFFAGSKSFNPPGPASSSKISADIIKDNISYPPTNHSYFDSPEIQNQHANTVETDTGFRKGNTPDKNSKKSFYGKSNPNIISTRQNLQDPYGKSNDSVNSSRTDREILDENSINDKQKGVLKFFGPANIKNRTSGTETFPSSNIPYSSSKKKNQFLFGQEETLTPDKNSTPKKEIKVPNIIQSVRYPQNEEDCKEKNSSNSCEFRAKSFNIEGLAAQAMLEKPLTNFTVSKSTDERLPSHIVFGRQITEEPQKKGIAKLKFELDQTENFSSSNNFVSLPPHPDRSKNKKEESRQKNLNLVSNNKTSLGAFPEESIITRQDLEKPAHLTTKIEIIGESYDENFKPEFFKLSETERFFSQQDGMGLNAPIFMSRKNEKKNRNTIGDSMFDSIALPDNSAREKLTTRTSLEQPALSSIAVEIQEGHPNEKAQVPPTEASHKKLMSEIKKFQYPERYIFKLDPNTLEYDIKTKNIDPDQGVMFEQVFKENTTTASKSTILVDPVAGKKNTDESFVQGSDQFLSEPSNFEVITSPKNSRASKLSNVDFGYMSQKVNDHDKMPNSRKEIFVDESLKTKDIFSFPKHSSDKIKQNDWTRLEIPNILLNWENTPRSISNQDMNKSSLTESKECGMEPTDQISNLLPVLKMNNENEDFSDTRLNNSIHDLTKNKTFSSAKMITNPERGQYKPSHKTKGILERATILPQINVTSSEDHNARELVGKEKSKSIHESNFQFDFLEEPFHKYLNVLEIEDTNTDTIPTDEISTNLVSHPQSSYPNETKDTHTSAALEHTNKSEEKCFEESTNKPESMLFDSKSETVRDQSKCRDDSVPKNKAQNINHQMDIFKTQDSVKTNPSTKITDAQNVGSTAAMKINVDNLNEIEKKVLNKTIDGNIHSATKTPKYEKNFNLISEKMNRNSLTENIYPNVNKENHIESIRLTDNEPVQYEKSNNHVDTTCEIGKSNTSDHDNLKSNPDEDILEKYNERRYPGVEEEISSGVTSKSTVTKLQSEESDEQLDTTSDIGKINLEYSIKNQMGGENISTGIMSKESFERDFPEAEKIVSKEIVLFTPDEAVQRKKSDARFNEIDNVDRRNLDSFDTDDINLRSKPVKNLSEEDTKSKYLEIEKTIPVEIFPSTKYEPMQFTKSDKLHDDKGNIDKTNIGELDISDINVIIELTKNATETYFGKRHPDNEDETSMEIIPLNQKEALQRTKTKTFFDATNYIERKNLGEFDKGNVNLQDKYSEKTLKEDDDYEQFGTEKKSLELTSSKSHNAKNISEPAVHFESRNHIDIDDSKERYDNYTKEELQPVGILLETGIDERNLANKKRTSMDFNAEYQDVAKEHKDTDNLLETAHSIDREKHDENAVDYEIMPDIAMEHAWEENPECKQAKGGVRITKETIPLTTHKTMQHTQLPTQTTTKYIIDKINLGENAADNEIVQGIATKPTLEETAEFAQPVIEEEISNESTPLSHDEAAQYADQNAHFNTTDSIEKKSLDENAINNSIFQNGATENTPEETANRKYPESETTISMNTMPLTTHETVQHIELPTQSHSRYGIDKERLIVIDADDINVQNPFTEEFDVQKKITEHTLEETIDFIQPVMEEEIPAKEIPLSHDDAALCMDSSLHFKNIDVVKEENLDENTADDKMMQDLATEPIVGETADFIQPVKEEEISAESTPLNTAEYKQPVMEEEMFTEITPMSPDDATQCVDLNANFDTADSIDKENLGEITANDEIVEDIITEPTMEETEEHKKSVMGEEIPVEKISLSHDAAVQCMDSSLHFENIVFVGHENQVENATDDEITQGRATEPIVGETAEFNHPTIEEEISTKTILLSHDDATQCADSNVHFDDAVSIYKENFGDITADDQIVQDIDKELIVEDTADSKMTGSETTISTAIIHPTTHEIGQHAVLATQSDAKNKIDKEILGVIVTDDINMQDPSTGNVNLQNITREDALIDTAKCKISDIEVAISEEKIHLTSHEDVLLAELAAQSDVKYNIEERRLSAVDTNNVIMQEIVGQRISDEGTESGLLELDRTVEMETISTKTHKSVQNAESAAKSDVKYDVVKEDLGENAVDDEISQVIESEHALEEIAEFKQPGNDEKISTEITPLSHVDAAHCTETATTLDSTNFNEKKNHGELDGDDINPQYMAGESLLEEGFESRHLEIEKEVEMEITPLITHEARKYSNSDIHFDNIDLIDKECLADIDVDNINLQDTALESVSYEGAEIRHHECENEISIEKIAMSQDEVLQSAESGAHVDTVDYIDKESRGEINTSDVNVHEMATENALGEADKSKCPQIEEKISMEIKTSTNDEVVQCANSDAVQATTCDLKEENFDEFNACGAFVENFPSEGLSEPTNDKHTEFNRETFIEINSFINNEAMQRANPDALKIATSDANGENIGELSINDVKDVNQEDKCSDDLSEKYTERRYFGNGNEALFELNPFAKNNIYQSVNAIASIDNKDDFSEDNCGDPAFQDAKTEIDFLKQELEISHSSQSQEKEKSINDKEVMEISESKLMLNENKLSLHTEDKIVQESNQLLKATSARQNSSVIDDAIQSGRLNTLNIVAGDGSKVILEELATQDRNVRASPALKLSGASEDSESKNEKISDHEITMDTQDVVENFDSKAKETKKREYVDVDNFEVNNKVSTEPNTPAKPDDVNLERSEISFGSVGEIIKEDLVEPAIRVDDLESGYSINKLEASQCSELKTKNSSDEKIEIDAIEVPRYFLSKSEYENVEEFALNELTNKVKEMSIESPPGTNNDASKSGKSNYAMNTSGDLPDQTLGASFGQTLSEGIDSSKILEDPENLNFLSELNNEEKKADDEIIARQIEQLSKPLTDKDKHQICHESRLLSPELHGTTFIPDKDCKKQHFEKPNGTEDSPNHPSKVSLSLQVASSNSKKNIKSDKGVIYEIEKESKLGPIVKSSTEVDENFVLSELPCVEVHSLDNTINENRTELIADNTVSHSYLNKKSTESGSTNPCSYDLGVASPQTHLVSGTEIFPEPDEKLTTASSTSLPCLENSNISDELSHSKLA